ncbi:MAG TPA: GC-type dockerin domain-anchored protein [Phycisphaerales bacterium]|nr:GC-type dockerin domain-anchored protein [Phycisphaerales bacterium]
MRTLRAACLAAGAAMALATGATAYPPLTVELAFPTTFTSGTESATVDYPQYFLIDAAGRVMTEAHPTTGAQYFSVVTNAGTPEFVGYRSVLGSTFTPARPDGWNVNASAFNAAGKLFVHARASLQFYPDAFALVMHAPPGPPIALLDSSLPDAGTRPPGDSFCTPGPGNWIILGEGSAASGLWAGDLSVSPPAFTHVLQAGMTPTGLPNDVTVSGVNSMRCINASGTYAYVGTLAGNVTDPTRNAIVRGFGTSQDLMARTGDPAPGMAGATMYSLPYGYQYDYLFISDSGEVAFKAQVTHPTLGGQAIFAGMPGSLSPIVTSGRDVIAGVAGRVNQLRFDQAPNGERVVWVGYNPNGSTGGYSSTLLMKGTATTPQILVRQGQAAPGLPLGTTLGTIREFLINDQGAVVFIADFSASTQYPTGGKAVFGWAGGPAPFLVLAPGEMFTLPDNSPRTVQSIQPLFGGWPGKCFSAQGRLAMWVFTGTNAGAIVSRTIENTPPPATFGLLYPPANAVSIETRPTLSWGASPNAESYTLTITPDGGSATTIQTTSTTLPLPAGLLQGCQQATWSVVATNEHGSTASAPVSQVFTTFSPGCVTPPVYTIRRVGLYGGTYTDNLATLVTPEGRVAGASTNVLSSVNTVTEAWIEWNGQTAGPLGLTGTPFGKSHSVVAINPAGAAIGTSARTAPGNVAAGSDAWYYDGTNVSPIGPAGTLYDQTPGSPTTRRNSYATAINNQGDAIGSTSRWANGVSIGNDTWRYHAGVTELLPGPTGGGYEFTTANGVWRSPAAVAINDAGDILGYSGRYTSTGGGLGIDSWVWHDGATTLVARTGPGFEGTIATGVRRSTWTTHMNNAGQVVGTSAHYDATGTYLGLSAFLWTNGAFQTVSPTDAVHPLSPSVSGIPSNFVKGLSPQGYVVGEFPRLDASLASIGTDTWYFDGTATRILGLTGDEFQTPVGAPDTQARKEHRFVAMNAAGQVVGRSIVQGVSPSRNAGWLFDPASGAITRINGLPGVTGAQSITPLALTPDGAVLGTYTYPNALGTGTITTPFIWSIAAGMKTLESRVIGALPPQGWQALITPIGGGGGEASHSWPVLIAGNGSHINNYGQTAFVLVAVPTPGSFPLLNPPDGATVASAQPVQTWTPSPGARYYSVSITPQGGPTTILETSSASLVVPPSIIHDCEHVEWSVVANSPSGSTLSTPPIRTFSYMRADFNLSGQISVQDIFDFLNAWLAGDPRADFNGGGLTVQDIFDYLNAWFVSCP